MLHDENYKRLFASPLMVQDVLRACLPAHRLAATDLSSLGKLSTEYVSDELLKRHGDTVWRLRLGRRHVYLLVLLEFQSEDDHWMALRTLTYSGLLYQELVRNRAPVVAAERLPAVLPVVLYNGAKPWTAAREMRTLVAPTELQPAPELVAACRNGSGASFTVSADLEAVDGADVVYTDVWASMGEEDREAERLQLLAGYQVNDALMGRAADTAIFMHDLPAVKGNEVTTAVFESPCSMVWEQAENRKHTAKALMLATLVGEE